MHLTDIFQLNFWDAVKMESTKPIQKNEIQSETYQTLHVIILVNNDRLISWNKVLDIYEGIFSSISFQHF